MDLVLTKVEIRGESGRDPSQFKNCLHEYEDTQFFDRVNIITTKTFTLLR